MKRGCKKSLRDIKEWLEPVGIPAAELRFLKPQKPPYAVYLCEEEITGGDTKNLICTRDVSVEVYAEKAEREKEQEIERLLDAEAIPYEKRRVWLESEKLFETIYDFTLIESKEE